jgi:hypothetical protein
MNDNVLYWIVGGARETLGLFQQSLIGLHDVNQSDTRKGSLDWDIV